MGIAASRAWVYGCRGVEKILSSRASLGDTPTVHYQNSITPVLHDAQVVTDQHIGQSKLILEILEKVEDLSPDTHVESRHGSSQIISFGLKARALAIAMR